MPSATESTPSTTLIRRVGILFAGGPAPAANAVISTAAATFRRNGIEAVGILHGYSHLVEFGPGHPMIAGRDYIVLDQSNLKRTRNTRDLDRHVADQSRQGDLASQPSGRSRAERTTSYGLSVTPFDWSRRLGLDRR